MNVEWTSARANLFFNLRAPRFGRLSGKHATKRVTAIERLVSTMLADPEWEKLEHIAYGLATVHHETASTYEPIEEYADGWDYDLSVNPRKARALGNTEKGDGPRFKGRGFVQLTGRSNYRRAGQLIGVDLESEPRLQLEWEPSYRVMTAGMYGRGLTFTGKRLQDFDRPQGYDFINARRIINGTDRAALIAEHARKYLAILERVAA